jgi:hypothetical protein
MARVYVLGAGTPTPTPERFGSSFVAEFGGNQVMIDCGPAATHKLVKAGPQSIITWLPPNSATKDDPNLSGVGVGVPAPKTYTRAI